MKPAPRPAARLLLAGRFLIPRASLLALPDGPVAGLDLSSGELVALAFGPGADSADAIAARVARWNEVARPSIRELRWHLGRPLASFDLLPADSLGAPFEADAGDVLARCAALGAALDESGLGLPCGPADLALGPDGPCLRRPAIWPADPAHPLAARLPELASRLLERVPAPAAEGRTVERGRVGVALACLLPGTRRARIALVVACGLLSALVVSSLAGSSRGGAVARAAPPRVAPHVLEALPAAAPRRIELHAHAAPAISRGGPARVLLRPPRVVPPAPPAVTTPAPAVRPVAEAPTRGWVEGLFVGS